MKERIDDLWTSFRCGRWRISRSVLDRQVWRDTVYIDGGGIITMSEITESGFSGAIEVLRIIGERLNYIKKEINSMPGLLVLARMIEEYQQE